MKTWTVILTVLALAIVLGGCGVMLWPTYSQLLDKTTALADDSAARAEANALSPDQMKQALRGEANVWRQFRDARDGKK